MSELLIDSTTDECEVNYPINATQQKNSEGVVYLYRARKGTMLSIMVIGQINDMKMKLGSKLKLRKIGKTKVDLTFQQRL